MTRTLLTDEELDRISALGGKADTWYQQLEAEIDRLVANTRALTSQLKAKDEALRAGEKFLHEVFGRDDCQVYISDERSITGPTPIGAEGKALRDKFRLALLHEAPLP